MVNIKSKSSFTLTWPHVNVFAKVIIKGISFEKTKKLPPFIVFTLWFISNPYVFHPKERGGWGVVDLNSFWGLKDFFPMVPPIKFPMVVSMVFPICSSSICSLMLCKKFLMLFLLFSYVSLPPSHTCVP